MSRVLKYERYKPDKQSPGSVGGKRRFMFQRSDTLIIHYKFMQQTYSRRYECRYVFSVQAIKIKHLSGPLSWVGGGMLTWAAGCSAPRFDPCPWSWPLSAAALCYSEITFRKSVMCNRPKRRCVCVKILWLNREDVTDTEIIKKRRFICVIQKKRNTEITPLLAL